MLIMKESVLSLNETTLVGTNQKVIEHFFMLFLLCLIGD